MNRILKKTTLSLLFLGSITFTTYFINTKNRGFIYQNFTLKPPTNFDLEFSNPQNMDSIFKQKFNFLDAGGECLAFSSEDDQWVLKVFKKHRLYPYNYLSFLTGVPYIGYCFKKRLDSYQRFWQSLKIQAENIKELSGLHFFHLPKDQKKIPRITLRDPCGLLHDLNLNNVCFVIQKKVDLFKTIYFKTSSVPERKQMLLKLIDFYKNLDLKGLAIWDNTISKNIGWSNNAPFIIDMGAVCPNSKDQTFENSLNILKIWIEKNDPELKDYFLDIITSQ